MQLSTSRNKEQIFKLLSRNTRGIVEVIYDLVMCFQACFSSKLF